MLDYYYYQPEQNIKILFKKIIFGTIEYFRVYSKDQNKHHLKSIETSRKSSTSVPRHQEVIIAPVLYIQHTLETA